jgi:hypothetical protein
MEQLEKSLKAGKKRVAHLPPQLTNHFSKALDNHDKLMQVARLSAQGIGMHLARPKAIQALGKAEGDGDGAKYAERLKQAEDDAALAQKEIEQGYPVLHGFVTIAMWSWLEDFVKGLAALWLITRRQAMRSASVARLKVRLGDYLALSRNEQALHIIELLDQDTGSGLRQGINRFQGLLKGLGLEFELDDAQQKTLFEFQMIRNNLAHRNGLVDQRLRQACPWLGLKLGQPVKVSRRMLIAYSDVGGTMLLNLLYCAGDTYGLDLRLKAPNEVNKQIS